MMSDTFVSWLNERLEERGWSMREFGRQIDVSPSHAARIINGDALPSMKLTIEIAAALDTSPEIVLRKAGLLPPDDPETEDRREAQYLFSQLVDEDQTTVLTIMRALLGRNRAEGQAKVQTDSL